AREACWGGFGERRAMIATADCCKTLASSRGKQLHVDGCKALDSVRKTCDDSRAVGPQLSESGLEQPAVRIRPGNALASQSPDGTSDLADQPAHLLRRLRSEASSHCQRAASPQLMHDDTEILRSQK